MAELVLGAEPFQLTVPLSPDADFVATIQRDGGANWPDGCTIKLVLSGEGDTTTWDATITGGNAVFNVDKAVVNTVINKPLQRKAQLFYKLGELDALWGLGSVRIMR